MFIHLIWPYYIKVGQIHDTSSALAPRKIFQVDEFKSTYHKSVVETLMEAYYRVCLRKIIM